MHFTFKVLGNVRQLIAMFVVGLLVVACGGGGGGTSSSTSTGSGGSGTGGSGTGTGVTSNLTLALFAGSLGGNGDRDGVGSAARFNNPLGVATDSEGNTYVADSANNLIRKVTAAGVVTTIAGGTVGSADGVGTAASFNNPTGIAVDSEGNIYVSDTNNNTIRKITPAGVVSTLAGKALTVNNTGSADGTGPAASFNIPEGLAIDAAGNIYVADLGNDMIRKITPTGVVTTLAGTALMPGSADGTGAAARFYSPWGVAVDSGGNIYVTDSFDAIVRKVTPAGVVTTIAGTAGVSGSADGSGAAASFNRVTGIAVDSADNVYVADYGNCTVRMIAPPNVVTTLAGTAGSCGSLDGTGAAARFLVLGGLAVDSSGNVMVADVYGVRKIAAGGVVTTIAGQASVYGSTNGTGAAASFYTPSGIASDAQGNLYLADSGNNIIRKITPAAVVTTLAGTAGVIGSADGTGGAASFNNPGNVATDSTGNVYVADSGSGEVRKITPAGVVSTIANAAAITAIAGITNVVSYGEPEGTWGQPAGIAVDQAGNVYVGIDILNLGGLFVYVTGAMIIKITPDGNIAAFAGSPTAAGSKDGSGAAASFSSPGSLATDSAGNVYVADSASAESDLNNNLIRKITPAGVVTTLAGTPGVSGSADGTGPAASFHGLGGIAADNVGDLYVADTGNNTIRKVTQAGVVTTVVGTTQPGFPGFLAGPLPGGLAGPTGVAIGGNALYITMPNGVAVVNGLP